MFYSSQKEPFIQFIPVNIESFQLNFNEEKKFYKDMKDSFDEKKKETVESLHGPV